MKTLKILITLLVLKASPVMGSINLDYSSCWANVSRLSSTADNQRATILLANIWEQTRAYATRQAFESSYVNLRPTLSLSSSTRILQNQQPQINTSAAYAVIDQMRSLSLVNLIRDPINGLVVGLHENVRTCLISKLRRHYDL